MCDIKEIAKIIYKNNGRLYCVGGAIRDKLCGIKPHDEDYCVTGLTEYEFTKLFKNAVPRGKSFKVYDINGKEFALARSERKIGDKHVDFEIVSNKYITIEQDLKRRDFTVNSMAEDILTGEIIDPYGGKDDLKNKILKATSDAFKEDPLRVYRAARFSSKLNFNVEDNTLKVMRSLKEKLTYISAERVFDEFRKALNSSFPQNFFYVLKKADLLDVHFKEVYNLIGVLQPEKYHPEGDAFEHSILALKKAASITNDEKIRFSVLVHDLGKALTPKSEYPHHINHDINGVTEVKKFGRRLKMPNSWIKCGITAASAHMKAGIFYKMKPAKKVEFIEQMSKTTLGLEGLEIVVESDRNCRNDKFDKVEFAKFGKNLMNNITGEMVMDKYNMKPGIKLKQKLHEERVNYLKSNYKSF